MTPAGSAKKCAVGLPEIADERTLFVVQLGSAMSRSGLHLMGPEDGPATNPDGVLLVEDDVAIVNSLGDALRDEGLEVAIAENGRVAIDLLRGGLRPFLIVLDLMMPVMDGWDFRHEQLRDPALRDIPVVVITATGFSADTIRAQFGDVELLPKPVPYPALLALLDRARGRGSTAA